MVISYTLITQLTPNPNRGRSGPVARLENVAFILEVVSFVKTNREKNKPDLLPSLRLRFSSQQRCVTERGHYYLGRLTLKRDLCCFTDPMQNLTFTSWTSLKRANEDLTCWTRKGLIKTSSVNIPHIQPLFR